MLFSSHIRYRPFIVNSVPNIPIFKPVSNVMNKHLENSKYKYMKNINNIIENRNKKKMIFGKNQDNDEPTSLIIVPSIFFLSLTTIIYYFYSKIN